MALMAIAIIGASIFISGMMPPSEGDAITYAKKRVDSVLKDPNSSKYSDVKAIKNRAISGASWSGYVCGYVNAKNSFASYTGARSFIVRVDVTHNGRRGVTSDLVFDSDPGVKFTSLWMEHCQQ